MASTHEISGLSSVAVATDALWECFVSLHTYFSHSATIVSQKVRLWRRHVCFPWFRKLGSFTDKYIRLKRLNKFAFEIVKKYDDAMAV